MTDLLRLLHEHFLPLAAWLTLFSLASLIVMLGLAGRMVVRLPADYFNAPKPKRLPGSRGNLAGGIRKVARNALGIAMIGVGLVLLIPGIPGQGLLTVLVGLLLTDFPGKHRLERRLMNWPPLRKGVNRLRTKRGRPPLDPPIPGRLQ